MGQPWAESHDYPVKEDRRDIHQPTNTEDATSLGQPDRQEISNQPSLLGDISDSDMTSGSDEANRHDEPSLLNQISKKMRNSRFDHKHFLPKDCLSQILTETNVRKTLPGANDSLIRYIIEDAPKTFATVLKATRKSGQELLKIMTQFETKRCTDALLYREEEPQCKMVTEGIKCSHPAQFRVLHKVSLWDTTSVQSFFHERWAFNAPVFHKTPLKHELPSKAILPIFWDDKDATESRSGGFGVVRKARICPGHQRVLHTDGRELVVAMKELGKTDDYAEPKTAWDMESAALRMTNSLGHQHLNRAIAAIKRGDHYYLILEWADGGSLQNFWRNNEKPDLNAKLIEDALKQLKGLCNALTRLHNISEISRTQADSSGNWRHGDLKPDNILRCKCKPESMDLGTLQIADLGLAKHHTVATKDRHGPTTMKYGTVKYEAPEAHPDNEKSLKGSSPRSRRYDVWSMGCIILEFIIWLLYGYEGLKRFNDQTVARNREQGFFATPFYMFSNGVFEVNQIAIDWMTMIQTNDPELKDENTVLSDLLAFVREKLLVINSDGQQADGKEATNHPAGEKRSGVRADAVDLENKLQELTKDLDKRPCYLFTGTDRSTIEVPSVANPPIPTDKSGPTLLVPGGRKREQTGSSHNSSLYEQTTFRFDQNHAYDHNLSDSWKFIVDNDFALRTLRRINSNLIFPRRPVTKALCKRCLELDFSADRFRVDDNVANLSDQVDKCALCRLLHRACTRLGVTNQILLYRHGSVLRMQGIDRPFLSLCIGPGRATNVPDIQIGFPNPSEEGDESRFHVISQWLDECDADANKCSPQEPATLPTRVIKVIPDTDSEPMHLCETRGLSGRYIALSHRWGDTSTHPPSSTNRGNIQARMEGISVNDLPRTFQDAVKITKRLGVPYLWIDSICIIQGSDGDWDEEAKRMEDVFSSAYCVIAATRASGTKDGFLEASSSRDFVTLSDGSENQFHICEAIDDFEHHVNQAELNTRGWVYQERALARRTIHFTKEQVYWECGHGIRCQTLTKMKNTKAELLADPNFPHVAAQNQSKGGVITFFQGFYEKYSGLALSVNTDRPVAIAGLESRLIRNLNVHGGYGIFDSYTPERESYLGRSLLWMRGSGSSMERIEFGATSKVPSWSWMSYKGPINYLEVPFAQVEWERREIESPWTDKLFQESSWHTRDRAGSTMLTAVAHEFSKPEDDTIIYDRGPPPVGQELKCVVIGRAKIAETTVRKTHYVLLIGKQKDGRWERVGVGKLMRKDIILGRDGIRVTIS